MKKTKVKRITVIAAAVILVTVGIEFRYSIGIALNKTIFNKARPSAEMTTEEKLEDFEYLYNIISANQPMLEDYKAVYCYDFAANKDYYTKLICATENDTEFLECICDIIGELPSFHTETVYGKNDSSSKYYGNEKACGTFFSDGYSDYWMDIEKELL